MTNSLYAALSCLIGAWSLSTTALAETNMRVISAWAPTLAQVKGVLYKFEENVTKASNGEIKFQNSGPETVPPFDQFQPLSAGVFDILYAASAYHQAQSGLSLAMQLFGDVNNVRKAGVLDYVNDYYRKKFGVEILALIRSPENTFVLKEAIETGSTLKGRKIRSNPLYDSAVRRLNAVPVAMGPADAYAAMQKGTLDGIAFPLHATADFKLYEVGKFMTSPGFGQSVDLLLANSKKLAALPIEQQKIIREQALKMEQEGTAFMRAMADQQTKTMQDNGVKMTQFSPEVAAAIDQSFAAGVIEVAHKSDPAAVDAMLELARSKGVLRY